MRWRIVLHLDLWPPEVNRQKLRFEFYNLTIFWVCSCEFKTRFSKAWTLCLSYVRGRKRWKRSLAPHWGWWRNFLKLRLAPTGKTSAAHYHLYQNLQETVYYKEQLRNHFLQGTAVKNWTVHHYSEESVCTRSRTTSVFVAVRTTHKCCEITSFCS